MLSDEEKEALRNFKSEYETCDHYSSDLIIELDDAEIILNLIEKQSKEIEHQIEKRANQKKELAILNAKQIEFNKLVNTVNSYKGQFKRQQKEIEELKKYQKYYEEMEEVNKKFIAVDKIKAKIEEYKKQQKEEPDAYLCIKVLRSLLEKE